ncbi:MAG: hypothetical protein Q8P49_04690 [Candidatus Liptonbacteria bacterium]|nr:hypothetical protein [Candidatus Liptonbacteria bacterium]
MACETDREILLITADAVKETGKVSYMFMITADPEGKLHPMPQKWGFIRKDDEGQLSFSVFEGGRGLVVAGGWGKQDDGVVPDATWEKELADALPSCTLLMDVDLLPWWEALAARNEIKFRRHHFTGILTTS